MISNGVDPGLLAKQATDTRDIVRFKQEMDGLKERLSGNSGDNEKELRKACQDFEAVFISKIWQGMKSTVPKEGYLHSKQEEQYMSMFDREFAEKMSRAGGIGLADMIYDQLSQKLKQTSRDTLSGAAEIKPLADQPIELARRGPIPLNPTEGMTLEDWGADEAVDTQVSGVVSSGDNAAGVATANSSTLPMSDVDVKARIEELARRLEADRIKAGLLGTAPAAAKNAYDLEPNMQVGQKLAKNG
ncbi:rod-binding protein [Pseudodesulfovibrio sp. zrk46]|uniref:rod-binding protein n=1 Tax=Pseudodesulfovibrio sp. zrk46 TaxID=2725288 RepID=UPI001449F743|nr:rod-binding protein [Pseudodesulfovibrio sp. zrk46]QJB57363.1 flagellar biosynthesis protein FlgJ [Pseudodesulfovibrio sp. zrk46]